MGAFKQYDNELELRTNSEAPKNTPQTIQEDIPTFIELNPVLPLMAQPPIGKGSFVSSTNGKTSYFNLSEVNAGAHVDVTFSLEADGNVDGVEILLALDEGTDTLTTNPADSDKQIFGDSIKLKGGRSASLGARFVLRAGARLRAFLISDKAININKISLLLRITEG